MSHEYDDHPVTNEAIEAAVTLTVELRSRRQSASIEELATEAVDSTFRTCVTGTAGTNAPERPGACGTHRGGRMAGAYAHRDFDHDGGT